MGLKTNSLERQLALATANLERFTATLDAKGVAAGSRKSNPRWRNLNAKCRQIRHQMAAVNALAARDAECVRRREEGAGTAE